MRHEEGISVAAIAQVAHDEEEETQQAFDNTVIEGDASQMVDDPDSDVVEPEEGEEETSEN